MSETATPLYGTEEARTATVVRCALGHEALRETFETVGGCPYCLKTPEERIAFLAGERSAKSTGNMLVVDGGAREAFPR